MGDSVKRFSFDNSALPRHFFRALCQNPSCHVMLGGFYTPCSGGSIIYACHVCGGVSLFRNGAVGIDSKFVPDVGAKLG